VYCGKEEVDGCYYNLDQPFKLVFSPFDFLVIRVEFDFRTDMPGRIISLSAEDTIACSSSEIYVSLIYKGLLDTDILTSRADFPVVSFFLRSVTRPRYKVSQATVGRIATYHERP
jgi:hypothetical protein